MRLKIILPNAIIVLLVGLLSWFVVRQRIASSDDPGQLKTGVSHAAQGAAGVLQLQLLSAERWLGEHGATIPTIRERLHNVELPPTAEMTLREKTTNALNDLKQQASQGGIFRTAPDLAAVVDKDGKARGRSDTTQSYAGEDFGKQYPALMDAIKDGRSGSDLWIGAFQHKHLVSYAPVKDDKGATLGVIVFGWTVNEKVMGDLAAGGTTVLAAIEDGTPKVKAMSKEADGVDVTGDVESGALKDAVAQAAKSSTGVATIANGVAAAAAPLANIGRGNTAAIVVARRAMGMGDRASDITWPILAAMALGVVFVLIAGTLVGNYITDPIGRMEETLLQVINGNTNQRIEIEHAELGGLAFRINQLLNTVLGVEEDTTDAEGRPSAPPAPNHFQEALAVDDRAGSDAAALAAEPEAAYQERLYREYIDAKRANGEAVDGITKDVFIQRIVGMERDAAAKFGKPVRYAVQRRDKQVVLLAIPLG